MKRKIMAITGMILCVSLVLTGCTIGSSANVSFAKDQTLTMTENNEFGGNFDSALAGDNTTFNILNNTQEGLIRNGPESEPTYAIAKSVSYSDNTTTYTFTLRDAKWSDGKPVTANDFEYAWKRALDPKTASPYAFDLYVIAGAQAYNTGKGKADQVGVKAKDPHTLEVHLIKPSISFLSLITLPVYYPLRKDIVEKYGNSYGTDPGKMVYDGPFTITKMTNMQMQLAHNNQYWDQSSVRLQKVTIDTVKDLGTGMNLYITGGVDITQLGSAFTQAYTGTPDIHQVSQATTQFLYLNSKNNFFKDINIRKAISMVIDRQSLTDTILNNGSTAAGSLIPPSLTSDGAHSFRQEGEIVQTNVAKAQALFKKGLADLNMSKPPADIKLDCSEKPTSELTAQYLKGQFHANFGWDVLINQLPGPSHNQVMENGNFDMGLLGWGADYDDPITHFEIFETNSPWNFGKFSNPQYDRLVGEAEYEPDPAQRYKELKQAEHILVAVDGDGQAGVVPLYYQGVTYVQKPFVQHYYRHPYGAEYTLKWTYIADHSSSQ